MSLKVRKFYLRKLKKKFKCKKINDLMYEIKIPDDLFYNIKSLAINYISKSFNDGETITEEKKLINKLIKKRALLKNVTPNGIIVPKNEISLEFNNFLKGYVEIIKFLNFSELIDKFHFPPNLRIKFPKISKSHMSRKHPTELMHADTWTGANPNWIAVHLFLLGDISKNNIRYAMPPKNFQEKWLQPLRYSEDGKKISEKFKVIDKNSFSKNLSFRKKNAGIRISLDTGFDMKMKKLLSFRKTKIEKFDVKKIRDDETITKEDFINIGKKTYFHFPDSFNQKVFHKGGFKHPTNPKLIRLGK